jgi:hypothetical protein
MARFAINQMAKLRCKRVAHPPYSPDLAICEFYLFPCLKDKLAGFHADEDVAFLQEVQEMVTAID